MSQKKLIFVYGTLKRGGLNHHYLAGQDFSGEARTAPGRRLFDLGGFPGLVARPEDTEGVVGEVWSVDDACLAGLDVLESIDENFYRRETVALLPPFAGQTVEAYVYPHDVAGRAEIGAVWTE